jgi:pyridinium-3,5-biscarboxylic acid mononucleotide sulfurtransferase
MQISCLRYGKRMLSLNCPSMGNLPGLKEDGFLDCHAKLDILKNNIRQMESIALAFSGGVDSTFLLNVAQDVLPGNVIAVTARSSTHPEREYQEAVHFAQKIGAKQVVIDSEEIDIVGFSDNPVNRCYLCKQVLFSKILDVAQQYQIRTVADGSNVDDLGDYRPGTEAAKELGVVSPLQDAGLSKEDIRILSREMGLPTWNKPAFACLSSRIPYGQKITKEKLAQVDRGEQFLLDLGFRQVRVRHHGDVTRLEVSAHERSKFFDTALMDRIYEKFREIGFAYVTLDLKGYRTGSMNEVIPTGKSEGNF